VDSEVICGDNPDRATASSQYRAGELIGFRMRNGGSSANHLSLVWSAHVSSPSTSRAVAGLRSRILIVNGGVKVFYPRGRNEAIFLGLFAWRFCSVFYMSGTDDSDWLSVCTAREDRRTLDYRRMSPKCDGRERLL